MLRGNSPARIDDKGRLKVPNGFRAYIEDTHGRVVFVTSVEGDSVLIYPMPVWLDIERRLAQMPSTHPARKKYAARTSFYGQQTELDVQGRVLIPPRLRESAQMAGEVDVLGQQSYLEIWNHDRLLARLGREPFSEEDARGLAEFGI